MLGQASAKALFASMDNDKQKKFEEYFAWGNLDWCQCLPS